MAKIQIRWNPNSLLPRAEQIKRFEWDENEYAYSEEALREIEGLMMMRVSFSVRTSDTIDIEQRREAIVFGTANAEHHPRAIASRGGCSCSAGDSQ